MSIPEPSISFVTEHAILLGFVPEPPDDQQVVHGTADNHLQLRICQLADWLRRDEGTRELLLEAVPGPGNLLLVMHPGVMTELLLSRAEAIWQQCAETTPSSRLVEIPVEYGGNNGPDLAPLSQHAGISPEEVIRRHSAPEYIVQCLGFMAGFAYLGGMDASLAIPRKKTPAARIVAGSVAIGGHTTGIYPSATPGGWHIIGVTSTRLFDPTSDSPCLLRPGDRLRFIPVGEQHD